MGFLSRSIRIDSILSFHEPDRKQKKPSHDQTSPDQNSSSLMPSPSPTVAATSHPMPVLSATPSSLSGGPIRCRRCRLTRCATCRRIRAIHARGQRQDEKQRETERQGGKRRTNELMNGRRSRDLVDLLLPIQRRRRPRYRIVRPVVLRQEGAEDGYKPIERERFRSQQRLRNLFPIPPTPPLSPSVLVHR